MVPSAYHSFFEACASVAGALIGLLFVAISVTPHKLSGDEASTRFRVKAGLAFATLINALIMSLVALLPSNNLGGSGVVMSMAGLSSLSGLAVMSLRIEERRPGKLFGLLVLLGAFVVQLVNSVRLLLHPHEVGLIDWEAYLSIAFFIVAIERAWELVGASSSRLLTVLGGVVQEHRQATPSDPDPDQPG